MISRDDTENNEISDVEDLEDALEKVTYNPLTRNM